MANPRTDEEVVVPFAVPLAQVPPCLKVRSTLITSSLQSLRENHLFDRYLGLLPESIREEILYVPAGVWVTMAAAKEHYTACDRLALGAEGAARLGGAVAARTQSSALGIVLRLAHEGGITPWTVIEQTPKYWGRLFDGSAVSVTRLGPKEARVETAGNSLQALPYFRHAFRGLMAAMTAPFCTKMYVRELPSTAPMNHHTVHRLAWA